MLFRSGIIVAFLTMVSRIFGLVRELFIAATFGSSAIGDCVNVAFKFPNLFRRVFGEGALSAVFIPVFTQKLLDSRLSARQFSGEVLTLLFLVLVGLVMLVQIAMPYLMLLIAPGFYLNVEKYELSVLLCRITTPYLIFISVTAIFGGMLNSVKKFAAFAFTPVIMNICVILFTHFLQGKLAAHFAISYALIFAGLVQILFMWFCLYRAGLTFVPSFNFYDPDVKKLIRNMGPATMSSGAQQINLFISQSIASFVPGTVSILSYADRLYQFPLALIGVTFGTILLPELAQFYKKKSVNEANGLQVKAIIIALAVSVPSMVGLVILSEPIIHLIYERGMFLRGDTIKTAETLAIFALGLPAFVLTKVLTPIFYANGDTKTPMRITIYSLVVNTGLNIVLMIFFAHVGIALGSSLAGCYNVWLLFIYAKRYGWLKIPTKNWRYMYKILISSVIMGLFLLMANKFCNNFYYSDEIMVKIISLFSVIFASIVIYILLLYRFMGDQIPLPRITS